MDTNELSNIKNIESDKICKHHYSIASIISNKHNIVNENKLEKSDENPQNKLVDNITLKDDLSNKQQILTEESTSEIDSNDQILGKFKSEHSKSIHYISSK